MASGIRVPVGADVVARKSGVIVDECENKGRSASITLYRGFYSQGYKSRYEQVETWWFSLSVVGEKSWTFRYSGKRAHLAREQFEDCSQAIG